MQDETFDPADLAIEREMDRSIRGFATLAEMDAFDRDVENILEAQAEAAYDAYCQACERS